MSRAPILIVMLCCLVTPALAQESQDITIGERMTMQSEILGEERPYWIHLPASYDDDRYGLQSYPVLYLLDGDAHFHSATGVVQFMSAGVNGNIQIPELIVVAIPNTNRTRDLTPTKSTVALDGTESPFLEQSGGGDAFLSFVRDELIPQIESSFRTLPYRVLVGHSFGGLLTLHTLLEEPDLFQAYVAIDPSLWWDDRLLVERARTQMNGRVDLRASVYITLADNSGIGAEEARIVIDTGNDFAAALSAAEAPHLRSDLRYFDAENHGSVPLLSLYHGLLYIFDGFQPSDEMLLNDPSAISGHFDSISERLGTRVLPPANLINQLGLALLFQLEEVDAGIELLRFNVETYPDSYIVHSSLAAAYEQVGESDLAIESLQRSLDLNPDNQDARDRLEALRSP